VHNLALQYAVDGYVKNLPDGRVELVLEGPDTQVDELVQSIRQKMNGFIKNMDQVVDPPTGEFHQFSIRH
jgi:acylphosphatase